MTNRICKLPNLCNLSNPTAISTIRVQFQQFNCNPSELHLDYTDWFELQNRTAILYHATSPTRGRMTNRICKLLNICNLSNPTAISAIRLQSSWIAVRLHRLIWIAKQNCNQIAISTIRLQSPQSECRHDATSLSTPGTNACICKLRNFFLECNLSNQSAISTIWLQSSCIAVRLHRLLWIAKPNCNLSNLAAILLYCS